MVETAKAKRDYELTEDEYKAKRVEGEIRQYERGIDYERKALAEGNLRPKQKEKAQWSIDIWTRQLERLRSGEWRRINSNYLHEQYAKMLKKAISTGQPVPQAMIDQAPEYKAARDARERYEKGWHTSFANRSVAINDQMKAEFGYKVKRQDGKPIMVDQLDEIAKGVDDVENVLGELDDLFNKTDITVVHTSGKHPFLTGAGGTYTSRERAVNIGVDRCKAFGHELGHWLDFESGKAEGYTTRLWAKTGHKATESTSTAEASPARYRDQKVTPLGSLISEATHSINNLQEVREIMRVGKDTDLTAEQKAEKQLIRKRLSAYWREPREVWARLVEQYLATKIGKENHATDAPADYEKRAGWWTKEQFDRMMPQVEAQIKARLRVLRGSDTKPPRPKKDKVPSKMPEIKLLTAPKTTTPPQLIAVGKEAIQVPVLDLTRHKLGVVAKTHGVSIGDLTDAARTLPEPVQQEVAINNPKWQDLILAKSESAATDKERVLTKAARAKLHDKPELPDRTIDRGEAVQIGAVLDKRSARAIAIDKALLAKTVVSIETPAKWIKAPNRFDIRGVDTPSGKIAKGIAYQGGGMMSRTRRKGMRRVIY